MGIAPQFFGCRSARSRSLLVAIIVIMMIDLAAIDLFLSKTNLIATAVITLMNVAGIAWFIREYIALGKSGIGIDDTALHFSVGTMYRFDVAMSTIESAARPVWKDIPQPGFPEAKDFLQLTKQAQPNVLFRLRDVLGVSLPMGRKRMIKRIAIHLDDPDSFITAITSHLSANG